MNFIILLKIKKGFSKLGIMAGYASSSVENV